MGDFGVKLQPEDGQRLVADGGERAGGGAGQRHELVRDPVDLVAVAHPDLGAGRYAREQRVGIHDLAIRPPVLPGRGPADAAAKRVARQLHAVADAEHRNAEAEERRIAPRRAFVVHARRAPGEDDAPRSQFADPRRRDVVADDLAVDVLLADAAGDQLGVLRAEVEHEHPFGLLAGCGRLGAGGR